MKQFCVSSTATIPNNQQVGQFPGTGGSVVVAGDFAGGGTDGDGHYPLEDGLDELNPLQVLAAAGGVTSGSN
jgi:hypothetical protein